MNLEPGSDSPSNTTRGLVSPDFLLDVARRLAEFNLGGLKHEVLGIAIRTDIGVGQQTKTLWQTPATQNQVQTRHSSGNPVIPECGTGLRFLFKRARV